MDALKLVPQIFFDAIGRVIPGLVAIALAGYLYPARLLPIIKKIVDINPQSWKFSAIAVLIVFAYVVGHLVSPLTKMVQRVFEVSKDKETTAKYDWLRVHHSEAGALSAKLRAEQTMYNALSGIFFMAAVSELLISASALSCGVLAVAGYSMALRGREGAGTFAKCVDHFHDAVRERMPDMEKKSEVDVRKSAGKQDPDVLQIVAMAKKIVERLESLTTILEKPVFSLMKSASIGLIVGAFIGGYMVGRNIPVPNSGLATKHEVTKSFAAQEGGKFYTFDSDKLILAECTYGEDKDIECVKLKVVSIKSP